MVVLILGPGGLCAHQGREFVWTHWRGLPFGRNSKTAISSAPRSSLAPLRPRSTKGFPSPKERQSLCPFGRMWWSQTGSNRRHPACKADALPTELWPRIFAETGPALDCHPAPDRLYGHRMRGPVTMAPAASGDLRSMSATLREQRDARMPTADERHRGIESRLANLVAEAGLEPAIYWV